MLNSSCIGKPIVTSAKELHFSGKLYRFRTYFYARIVTRAILDDNCLEWQLEKDGFQRSMGGPNISSRPWMDPRGCKSAKSKKQTLRLCKFNSTFFGALWCHWKCAHEYVTHALIPTFQEAFFTENFVLQGSEAEMRPRWNSHAQEVVLQ